MTKQIEALRSRLDELRTAKESARDLHNLFFSLHLADEVMQMHKIIHDLSIRIEQMEFLLERHIRKHNPDSQF